MRSRVLTFLALLFIAPHWRYVFRTHPCLYNARHYGHYDVMAGFYNDQTGGWMLEWQARLLCTGLGYGQRTDSQTA